MKQFNLSILTALLFVFTFSSCGKDDKDPLVIEPTLTGIWDIEKASMKLFEGNTLVAEQITYRTEFSNQLGIASFRFVGNNEFFITDDNGEEVRFTYTVDANNSKKLTVKTEDDEAVYIFPGSEFTYSFDGDKLVIEISGQNLLARLSSNLKADINAADPDSNVVITITSVKRK